MKRVGIDVDGILACFFKAYEDLTVAVSGVDLFPARYPEQLPPTWNWPEHYGYSDQVMKEVWRRIKTDGNFWYSLGPLPGAEAFLEALDTPGIEAYFITDRPGVGAQLQTAQWLNDAGYPLPSVIISRKGKGIVCNALSLDYYIDDKTENIQDVVAKSPGTSAYLLDYPYNRACEDGIRVKSLAEFLEVIK